MIPLLFCSSHSPLLYCYARAPECREESERLTAERAATIAAAVYAGRRFAEEFGDPPRAHIDPPFKRLHTELI